MIHFETVSESYGKVGHDLEERTKTTSTRQPRHMARRILVRSMARQRRKSSKMTGKIRQELGALPSTMKSRERHSTPCIHKGVSEVPLRDKR